MEFGPTGLVIIQATPYCNINCTYCYLPDRQDRSRMSSQTLEAIVQFLLNGPELAPNLSIVWHAGEPMVLSRRFYAEAFALFSRLSECGTTVEHHFQTNGTLISDEWCRFFLEHRMRVGLSIDGPQALHDRNRTDRRGNGTFARTMRGAELLRKHGIPFSTIGVLSAEALRDPDGMWNFVMENGLTNVGFNVEEAEGANIVSSLSSNDSVDQFRHFFKVIAQRASAHPEVRVRELADTRARVCSTSGKDTFCSENTAGAILSFGVDGSISTYSPELLSICSPTYGRFAWGNVHKDSFEVFKENLAQSVVSEHIKNGIEVCRTECEYFTLCGGGAPSNKLAEQGTFEGSETWVCRMHVKAMVDIVIQRVETELGL